ncbi:MAG TPA: DUF4295 family protein [Brumimicrobium sp.]|nr:DUF4295 family protein [Brumimicrobium sp.]
MAKKAKSKIQTGGGKAHTKVVKMVKTEKGSYTYQEEIVLNDDVKQFFAKN